METPGDKFYKAAFYKVVVAYRVYEQVIERQDAQQRKRAKDGVIHSHENVIAI
jgi:hypothetical protein